MHRRTTLLATIVLASLTLSGIASADEGRGRTSQQRPNGWGRSHAVARPLVAPNAPAHVSPGNASSGTAVPANISTTTQEGRANAARVVQTGTGNIAGIRQFGRDNTGAITQVGSSNGACLIQAGRNLDGAIQQVGDNQSNGLLQTRWGSAEIPVEVCATATTRADLMAYAPERPEAVRGRAGERGMGRPDR